MKNLLHRITTLTQFVSFIGKPATRFFHDFEFDTQINDFSDFGDSFAIHDVEFHYFKRRSHFVFHHFHFRSVTSDVVCGFLNLTDPADVKTNRCIEFQCVTTGCGFRTSEHNPDFIAELVDENTKATGFVDGTRQFTESLAHQTSLKTHFAFAHFAFQFTFWNEGCHGVNYDNVDRPGTNEVLGNFKSLFTIIGLRDQKVLSIDTQLFSVGFIKCVFRIDEGCNATCFLGFGDAVHG